MEQHHHGEILLYRTEDGQTKIEVHFQQETVWLTLDQMAELFDRNKSTISRHIQHIFTEGELVRDRVVAKYATTAADGKTYQVEYYNLDVIISVGYRVKSLRGTQFRIWASNVLKEYLRKGFAMDDDRLKGNGGGDYWKELLDRIRDIRSSEKVLYRQVLDLFATSVDYAASSEEAAQFFAIVQNKLHYAAHGHTAAEVIYERADAEKPFMGLQTFTGDFPTKRDIGIAKNYLHEDELKVLNNLVSGYFDFAEIRALEHTPMRMRDYIAQLDAILQAGDRKLQQDGGTVSHGQAIRKAEAEYRKFQVATPSPIEEAYFQSLRQAEEACKESKQHSK